MTLADAANTVARAASESAEGASDAAVQRIAVAAAALVLPVLWGLAVHLIFNWISRRCGETPSEEPVMQDYQI